MWRPSYLPAPMLLFVPEEMELSAMTTFGTCDFCRRLRICCATARFIILDFCGELVLILWIVWYNCQKNALTLRCDWNNADQTTSGGIREYYSCSSDRCRRREDCSSTRPTACSLGQSTSLISSAEPLHNMLCAPRIVLVR